MIADGTPGPYAEGAPAYREAGWAGVLPLPRNAKWPPPSGYTGASGTAPDDEQIDKWAATRGDGNLALRLPDGVVALDFDLYKPEGRAAFNAAVSRYGPLPATWVATSRIDGSGKPMFRVPPGTKLPGTIPGGEAIQWWHRYVMAWPSTNPDDNGRLVRWIDPDGVISDRVPSPDEFAALPEPWLRGLQRAEKKSKDPAAVDGDSPFPPGEFVSVLVREAFADGRAALEGQSRHDNTLPVVLRLIRLKEQGHSYVDEALAALRAEFIIAISDRATAAEAGVEFDNMVAGAERKVADEPTERSAKVAPGWVELVDAAPVAETPSPWKRIELPPQRMTWDELRRDVEHDFLMGAVSTVRDIMALPPLEWHPGLEGLLQVGVTSCIAGASGAGKSLWTLQHCVDLALSGTRIVYVALEGRRGFNGRVRAQVLERIEGLPNPEQAAEQYMDMLDTNLFFYDLRLALWNDPRSRNEPDRTVDTLRKTLRLLQADICVVDTMVRTLNGADENDNVQMQAVVDAADTLRYAEDVSVWLIHHAGHDQDRGRGASSVRAALDNYVMIAPVSPSLDGKDGRDLVVRVRSDKVKDGGQSNGRVYRKHVVTLGTLKDGSEWTAPVFRREENVGANVSVDEASVYELLDKYEAVTVAQVREATTWSTAKANKVLKDMTDEDKLKRQSVGRKGAYLYTRPEGGDDAGSA